MSRIKSRLGDVVVGDNFPTIVMGVINLDPQSFYQPSFFPSLQEAISAVERMVDEGVDILDIGGASTAPGSVPVSIEEETKRIRSVIRSISQQWDIPVSIDTQRVKVAQVALSEGATIVNDVSGLKFDSSMAAIIKDAGASCIVMAAESQPGDQHAIPNILSALQSSLRIAQSAGISKERIAIDPGIGFGKPIECDLAIIRNLRDFRVLNQPILLGISRKHFIGQVLRYNSSVDRLFGTVAASTIAILNGVHILRTHDVRATKDCVKMVTALQTPQECE